MNLPADGLWYSVAFDLTASDMSLVSGALSLNDVLAGVDELRILSAAGGPTNLGDSIVANLGVDNIRAVPAPGASQLTTHNEQPTIPLSPRPVRLVAPDTALSRRRQGFDSPTGY